MVRDCECAGLTKKQVPFDSLHSLRAGSPLRSLRSAPVGMTKFCFGFLTQARAGSDNREFPLL
jgi:hypothetical protein